MPGKKGVAEEAKDGETDVDSNEGQDRTSPSSLFDFTLLVSAQGKRGRLFLLFFSFYLISLSQNRQGNVTSNYLYVQSSLFSMVTIKINRLVSMTTSEKEKRERGRKLVFPTFDSENFPVVICFKPLRKFFYLKVFREQNNHTPIERLYSNTVQLVWAATLFNLF